MFVEVRVDLIGSFEEVPFSRKLCSHRRCQSLFSFALRDLYIISYLLEFVKRFCKSFLSFFRRPSRSSRFRSWRDFYIISYLKPFVKRFLKNSWNSFFRCSCEIFTASLSLTAIIVYHTCRDLSRVFSNFFEIIFPHPFSTISYFQFSVGVHASYTLPVRRRLIINIIEIMSHWFIIRHMI